MRRCPPISTGSATGRAPSPNRPPTAGGPGGIGGRSPGVVLPAFLGLPRHGRSGIRADRPSRPAWAAAIAALLDEADVLGSPSRTLARATAMRLGVSDGAVLGRYAEVARHALADSLPTLGETAQLAITACADIAAAIAVLRGQGCVAHGAAINHAIRHAPGRLLTPLVRRTDSSRARPHGET